MKINVLFLTASLGLAAAPGAWADIIFETSAGPYGQTVNPPRIQAQSFKTGPASSTFADVVLKMLAGSSSAGGFSVDLYDATGPSHLPGTKLLDLTGEANPIAAGNYTYTGTYTLAPNTDYWIEAMVSPGGGNYIWAKQFGGPPITGKSTYGRATSYNSVWEGPYAENMSMQVNDDASGVPEPSQWAMMAVTCLGAVGYTVRRVRTKAS